MNYPNAMINRDAAMSCLKAGATVDQIAGHWPKIWMTVDEGEGPKLGQLYDDWEDGEDGTPRGTTRYTMTGIEEFINNIKGDDARQAKASLLGPAFDPEGGRFRDDDDEENL